MFLHVSHFYTGGGICFVSRIFWNRWNCFGSSRRNRSTALRICMHKLNILSLLFSNNFKIFFAVWYLCCRLMSSPSLSPLPPVLYIITARVFSSGATDHMIKDPQTIQNTVHVTHQITICLRYNRLFCPEKGGYRDKLTVSFIRGLVRSSIYVNYTVSLWGLKCSISK